MGAKLHRNPRFRAAFPRLSHLNHSVTSQQDVAYNCVAWAVGDTSKWWWPDALGTFYWPAGIARQETVAAFEQMLRTLGFAPCVRLTVEKGIEKIVLFASSSGVPTHLAKQTKKGKWSSKLGAEFDIEHVINALDGPEYGTFHTVYCRS